MFTEIKPEITPTAEEAKLAPLRPYARFIANGSGREVIIKRTEREISLEDPNVLRRIVLVYEPQNPNSYQVIEVNTFRNGFQPA